MNLEIENPFDPITTANLTIIVVFTVFLSVAIWNKQMLIVQRLTIITLLSWNLVHCIIRPVSWIHMKQIHWDLISTWLGTYEIGLVFRVMLFVLYMLTSQIIWPEKKKVVVLMIYLIYLTYGLILFIFDQQLFEFQNIIWNCVGIAWCFFLFVWFGLKPEKREEAQPIIAEDGKAIVYGGLEQSITYV